MSSYDYMIFSASFALWFAVLFSIFFTALVLILGTTYLVEEGIVEKIAEIRKDFVELIQNIRNNYDSTKDEEWADILHTINRGFDNSGELKIQRPPAWPPLQNSGTCN